MRQYDEIMAKRKTTIEDLARMVKGGFDDVTSRMAKKEDIAAFEKWVVRRFDLVDVKLREIDKKLRNVVYRHEFEALEGRVKDLEDLFAVASKRR